MKKRLVISDLHFGGGDDLMRSPLALERLEPELIWADEVVINGDLFELVFASLEEAVKAATPFLQMLNKHVARIYYGIGNHDHHFVSLAGDERRLANVIGMNQSEPFRVRPAEHLLQAFCHDTEIVTAYPILELDGIRYTHGHYIAPHIESFGWRMMDRLAWRLTGETQRPEALSVSEYEALISPLYELMYEMANLPSGKRAQQQFERWLVGMGVIARAPFRASHQVVSFAHSLLSRSSDDEGVETVNAPLGQIILAMQTVCHNLHVDPGKVVFSHTHEPVMAMPSPDNDYLFYNSGSWIWDKRIRGRADYKANAWPGTVLRATGNDIEKRSLLEDMTEKDFIQMLGIPVKKRRQLFRRPQTISQPQLVRQAALPYREPVH